MKELDPIVMFAVFQEMLGPVLWLLVALAVGGIALALRVFLRDGGINSRLLVRSELIGLLGGAGALVLMAKVTHSGFTDAGGPVDWLLIGLIWGIGLAGTTILAYGIQGMLKKS
jgi:hypothetical protein